jgi:hypothetical protein
VLKLAIDAGLPLITISTDDVVNAGAVITSIAGKKAQPYSPNLKPNVEPGLLYYIVDSDKLDLKVEYQKFSQRGSILIVINPRSPHTAAFDAGIVTTPPELIGKFVEKYGAPENHAGLMAALAGLSFEQVFQVSKLAMTKHGEYTPRAVRDIRRTFFGAVRGLQMLSTEFLYYSPTPALTEWLASSGRFLSEFDEPLLTPRGLIFNGPPGTGKTMGAKYIARELDLPLYHLDVAGLMEKYVGESENNLRVALRQAEQSAPCIIIIDEVEKLFSMGNDDTGVTTRMLSTILWWLQEHQSKVFTIMTTNKETAIPPELYRPGRIDSEIKFTGLEGVDVFRFVEALTVVLSKRTGLIIGGWDATTHFPEGTMTHAFLTKMVIDRFKKAYLNTKEG